MRARQLTPLTPRTVGDNDKLEFKPVSFGVLCYKVVHNQSSPSLAFTFKWRNY